MEIILALILTTAAIPSFAKSTTSHLQETSIQTSYDRQHNLTTVSLPVSRISEDRDQYHSLDFTVSAQYEGEAKRTPDQIKFELITVVKERQLNSDLYVVFELDGKSKHFGSNRAAILNPVPDRRWIGERMVFLIPYNDFTKFGEAKSIAVKLGGVRFEFSNANREAVREFLNVIRN